MERGQPTSEKHKALNWLLLPFLLGAVGCEPSSPPPKLGVEYWSVQGIGGPIQVRKLPPSGQILADYDRWLDSESATEARVYEARLLGASNQIEFSYEVRRGETPMGRPEQTYVTFIYRDPTNGSYELLWHRLGRHDADFLNLSDTPKRVWLVLNRRASDHGLPKLEIVAFEGVDLGGGVIAEPGKKQP